MAGMWKGLYKMHNKYIYTACTLHRDTAMAKKFPIKPLHPERVCWGCDRYCAADSMICGNGSERTQHPIELFGDDWASFGLDPVNGETAASPVPAAKTAAAALSPSCDLRSSIAFPKPSNCACSATRFSSCAL